MDAQNIGVAAGVVSVAVAALGLVLTWYRREEKEERKGGYGRAQRTRARIFATVAFGIVALAAGGVALTFTVGATGNKGSGASAALTATQYRGRLGQICSDAYRKAQSIAETSPTKTVFGLEATAERDEVGAIKRLVPPDALRVTNANMIAVWGRRISLLESLYTRWRVLSNSEKVSALGEADRLAGELAKIFRSVGVQECVM